MRHPECDVHERQVWSIDQVHRSHFRSFEEIVMVVGSRRGCGRDL